MHGTFETLDGNVGVDEVYRKRCATFKGEMNKLESLT